MDKFDFALDALPDIEMYGGETTPWELDLIEPDGSRYDMISASRVTCTLSVGSYGAFSAAPVITKTGNVEDAGDGTAKIVFRFNSSDTRGLRGKFIYQIEVEHENDVRIGQGYLLIKQNIG